MTADPLPARYGHLRARRRLLLLGCAFGSSMVLVTAPERAAAQAFQGSPSTVAGSVSYDRATPGVETITVESDSAIVQWDLPPSGSGEYLFLPEANVATFQNGASNADFVVLNRIASTAPSRFDGTVLGRISDGLGNVSPGGTILFSSPGGIIVGGTALFDVGNLVLTTLNVIDEEGTFVTLSGGFEFDGGAAQPNAAVVTQAGSRIVASPEGSYVALVAPRVIHGGSVRTNGSTAFIAGEEVEFTVNQGLFDIVVSTGSDNPNPIVHTGSTGGPASAGGADNHRIYMVALPKNQTITALLSGQVGFDAATDVTVENGAIILSAGHGGVFGDSVDTATAPAQDASFAIDGGTVTSDLFGYASTEMSASGATASLVFQQDVSLFGAQRARLFAANGETVSVAGNALVSAARSSGASGLVDVTGGEALAYAESGGTLNVTGNLAVDASGSSGSDDAPPGDGTGGTARVFADNASIQVSGDLAVLANGTGAAGYYSVDAGDGFGGSAAVQALNQGSVVVSGDLSVRAEGIGGDGGYSGGSIGDGTGGNASLEASGDGSVVISGDTEIAALGSGGSFGGYYDTAYYIPVVGGSGLGGSVVVTSSSGGEIRLAGTATLDAAGQGGSGGFGGAGGSGAGGSADLSSDGGELVAQLLDISAAGIGGIGGRAFPDDAGNLGPGGDGGEGVGGQAAVRVGADGALTVESVRLDASGTGGAGAEGGFGSSAGNAAGQGGEGGTGRGGTALVGTTGGTLLMTGPSSLDLISSGRGGSGGDGGDSFGTGPAGDGGAGGDGFAGTSTVQVVGGSVTATSTNADAGGFGGSGGAAGDSATLPGGVGADGSGTGGIVRLSVTDGNGASGSASLGATVLVAGGAGASGTAGASDRAGRIIVEDVGSASGGLAFTDLSASSTGAPAGGGPAFEFSSDAGPVAASGDVSITVAGDVIFTAAGSGGLEAEGGVFVITDGAIALDHDAPTADAATVSGASVVMDSGTAISGSAGSLIEATGGAAVLTAPVVDVGRVSAGGSLFVTAGTISLVEATAGQDVSLEAQGDILVGQAQAGDDFVANAGGAFTGGTVVTTGLGPDGDSGTPPDGSNIRIEAAGDVRLDTGSAPGTISLVSSTGSLLSSGTLTAETLIAEAPLDILLNDVSVVSDLNLATAGGEIAGNSFSSDGNISLDSSGTVTLTGIDSGGFLTIRGAGTADVGTLTAVGGIVVDAAAIRLGSVTAGVDIDLGAPGNIVVGQAQAGDDFIASAGGAFAGGTIVTTGRGPDGDSAAPDGSNISIGAVGDLRLDTGTAPGTISLASSAGSLLSSGTLTADTLSAETPAEMLLNDVSVVSDLVLTTTGGDIVGNAYSSDGNISLDSSGAVILTSADSGGLITIGAAETANLGALAAQGDILVDAAAISLGSADASGDVDLSATGDINVGTANAGDDFLANAGGAFTGGTITANVGSDIIVTSVGDLRLDDAEASGLMQLTSTGGSVLSDGLLSAGVDLEISAAADIALGEVEAGNDILLDSLDGALGLNRGSAGRDMKLYAVTSIAADTLDSGRLMDIQTFVGNGDPSIPRNISLGTATAGALLTVGAYGAVVADGLVVSGPGLLYVGSTDSIRVGSMSSGGDVELFMSPTSPLGFTINDGRGGIDVGAIDAQGSIRALNESSGIVFGSADAGGSITISTTDPDPTFAGFTSGRLTAGGAIAVNAGGAVAIDSANSGESITAEAGRDLRLDSATAVADITLAAGGSITSASALNAGETLEATAAGDTTLNRITASGVEIAAQGTAAFTGAVDADTIAITSADIAVTGDGSLGSDRTQLVALTVLDNGQPTVIGGSADGTGYSLTADEAGTITAATLRIGKQLANSSPGGDPDLLIRDLTLSGERIGRLEIQTDGVAQVEGALLLEGVRTEGGIALTAGERIQIVTPTGSIRVRDANGMPGGTLTMTSPNIWAASQSLLDRLQADPNFAGRNEALLANDGPLAPRGYIEAADVTLRVTRTLFVQNSGGADFAGITVGSTLAIVPIGTSPLDVFAFGRRLNPDGTYVTNDQFFADVIYDGRGGPVGFTDESEFNRCVINTGVCPAVEPEPVLGIPGSSDIVEGPLGGKFTLNPPRTFRQDLVDTSFSAEPLVEEPVTSGGDSILWECDVDGDGDCDGGD
ncbi:hypothetical protein [Sphingosinicella sp. CPCC 101087]|uniref:hypothetical protein n=1 Tax=Sphingosinicella sp. CPCC 101087 TaxID=2497754 RepID=UPI0013EDC2D9|nr:hypothetical protein [Sphingosinicella sp. CPCC 101087]